MTKTATLGDEVILMLRLRRIATARHEKKNGDTIGVETVLTFAGATVSERDIAALNAMQHERELQLRIVAIQRPLLEPELGVKVPRRGRRAAQQQHQGDVFGT